MYTSSSEMMFTAMFLLDSGSENVTVMKKVPTITQTETQTQQQLHKQMLDV